MLWQSVLWKRFKFYSTSRHAVLYALFRIPLIQLLFIECFPVIKKWIFFKKFPLNISKNIAPVWKSNVFISGGLTVRQALTRYFLVGHFNRKMFASLIVICLKIFKILFWWRLKCQGPKLLSPNNHYGWNNKEAVDESLCLLSHYQIWKFGDSLNRMGPGTKGRTLCLRDDTINDVIGADVLHSVAEENL